MSSQSRSADTARHGLSRDEALQLCQRVLGYSRADHARVNLQSGWRGFTRVATNRITTSGGSSDVSVRIMSVFGKRVASVSTNSLDEASLASAVRRSEQLARISPEDPDYMGELGPQEYEQTDGYYESTGAMSPEARAETAALAIRAAENAGLVAAGFMDVRAGAQAMATSTGLRAYFASTGVALTLTVRTPDGSSSGWAGDEANDWEKIESERVAADAVDKCLRWRDKTSLEPGRYTVILEPTAVGMLMRNMRGAFNARTADEGRSFFSKPGGGNRLGEKLFEAAVTLTSDPSADNSEVAPFAGQGEPRGATVWVSGGVVGNLSYSRFWADRQGRPSQPGPSNFLMAGGDSSTEAMIESTRRGVLITRFWYIRGLNPRTISFTGLTRDGTFLIENGRISRPVNNFRFNQSLVEMLNNVEAMGPSRRVAASENSSVSSPIVVPALKVREFNLSSVSDAI